MKKARKELQKEVVQRAYFEYWRLQNDPEYLLFYEERRKKRIEVGDPIDFTKADSEFIKQRKRFRLKGFHWGNHGKIIQDVWVDPFKKIDWTNFLKNPDREIMLVFESSDIFKPVSFPSYWARCSKTISMFVDDGPPILMDGIPVFILGNLLPNYLLENNNIMPFYLDLRYDKKEILFNLSEQIDRHRKIRGVEPMGRDSLNKFHLYAQVWDARKGEKRMRFSEITKLMGAPISTIKSRFYRAFNLIYGRPYDSDVFQEARGKVAKETLRRTCGKCEERDTCREICPDVILYVEQDRVKLSYREVLREPTDRDQFLALRDYPTE
jgi:hypothetical protein